jgi:hypothetical protein
MYTCQKCGSHTTGVLKECCFENVTPYGVTHSYRDCLVCECGFILSGCELDTTHQRSVCHSIEEAVNT